MIRLSPPACSLRPVVAGERPAPPTNEVQFKQHMCVCVLLLPLAKATGVRLCTCDVKEG